MPLCIPRAGTAALPQSPIWWNNSAGPFPSFNQKLDDPRWVGALVQTQPFPVGGSGAGSAVIFRALHGNDGSGEALFLSWIVKFDPSGPTASIDTLYLGLAPGIGIGVSNSVLKVSLATSNALTAAPPPTPAFSSDTGSVQAGGTVNYTGTAPSWLEATQQPSGRAKVWISYPVQGATWPWAVALRIPLDGSATGLPVVTSLKLWYEVQLALPTAGAVTAYTWPVSTPSQNYIVNTNANGNDIYPQPTAWDPITLQAGLCPNNDGVSLAEADIGIEFPIGAANLTNEVRADLNVTPPVPLTNRLAARPLNKIGKAGDFIAKTAIGARFRIANFGSQPQIYRDSNGVELPNLWQDISGLQPAQSDINYNQKGEIFFDWTPSAAWVADLVPTPQPAPNPPLPPKKTRHQCMLVELEGPGLTFANNSITCNIDFVDASEVTREAEISVETLEPLTSSRGTRDVYLFVEPINMPPRIDPRELEQSYLQRGLEIMRYILDGKAGELSPHDWERIMPHLAQRREEWHMIAKESDPGDLDDTPWDAPTLEDLMLYVPTIRVHAFHTTDLFIRIDGIDYPIVEPQGMFGLMFGHNGLLYGWGQRLEGLAHLANNPNVYVAHVPDKGYVRTTMRIVAFENPDQRMPPEDIKRDKDSDDSAGEQPLFDNAHLEGCLISALTLAGRLFEVFGRILEALGKALQRIIRR